MGNKVGSNQEVPEYLRARFETIAPRPQKSYPGRAQPSYIPHASGIPQPPGALQGGGPERPRGPWQRPSSAPGNHLPQAPRAAPSATQAKGKRPALAPQDEGVRTRPSAQWHAAWEAGLRQTGATETRATDAFLAGRERYQYPDDRPDAPADLDFAALGLKDFLTTP